MSVALIAFQLSWRRIREGCARDCERKIVDNKTDSRVVFIFILFLKFH
jgi:hypothetical protein